MGYKWFRILKMEQENTIKQNSDTWTDEPLNWAADTTPDSVLSTVT